MEEWRKWSRGSLQTIWVADEGKEEDEGEADDEIGDDE